MQATARFHDGVTNPVLQEANFVFHDSIAFHPTNGVFNTHSGRGNSTIGLLLRRGQFPTMWGFLGLDDRDARQAKPLKALILIQATTGWQRIAGQFGNRLISGFTFVGMAQEAHVTGLRDHEEVFERVTLLLATVVFLLLFGIDRALNRTFGTSMPKRGAVDFLSVSDLAANSAAVRAGSSA